MLIFGNSIGDWKAKAKYAEKKGDNEYAKVHAVRCEGIPDVQTAMAAMAAFAVRTKCEKFIYHATINLNPGERLTPDQWLEAINTLENNLKLTGHYRILFEHIKKNRQHYHIYWSRLPPEGGAAVNMGNNYYIHQNTAKALEKKFGLKPAPSKDKSKPSKKRQEINDRNSRFRVEPEIVTKDVTRIYRESRTAKNFIKNLAKEGYALTRGKNGSFVIVDKQGGYHGLMRRIDGIRLADLRRKFPELDEMQLPSLASILKSRRPASAIKRRKNFKRGKIIGLGFPSAAKRFTGRRSVYAVTKAAFALASRKVISSRPEQKPRLPRKLNVSKKGWPKAAIIDWEAWGHKNPPRFFAKWPELAPEGFLFSSGPSR